MMKTKNCPCCNSSDIYRGYLFALALGVRCFDCGIQISRTLPETNTENLTMKQLEIQTIEKAINAWNKRPE